MNSMIYIKYLMKWRHVILLIFGVTLTLILNVLYARHSGMFLKSEGRHHSKLINSRISSMSESLNEIKDDNVEENADLKKVCPKIPRSNGINLKELLNYPGSSMRYTVPRPGGIYHPKECKSTYSLAVIVPYRNRTEHLRIFIDWIHFFLQSQYLQYCIYIIEQHDDKMFNRAKLLNVGYVEARKDREYDCYVFHDVDLLPLSIYNLYRCDRHPKHLSAVVDSLGSGIPYWNIFGGASALSDDQMKQINGFSNVYWDWGAEDDDAAKRLFHQNMSITRYPVEISKYQMLSHEDHHKTTSKNYIKLFGTKRRYKDDGLNSLEYNLVDRRNEKLFTRIVVNL